MLDCPNKVSYYPLSTPNNFHVTKVKFSVITDIGITTCSVNLTQLSTTFTAYTLIKGTIIYVYSFYQIELIHSIGLKNLNLNEAILIR